FGSPLCVPPFRVPGVFYVSEIAAIMHCIRSCKRYKDVIPIYCDFGMKSVDRQPDFPRLTSGDVNSRMTAIWRV
ncbi:MAG: hypothetical protein WBN81_08835, partial [Gammaproteobacteria bacterium]